MMRRRQKLTFDLWTNEHVYWNSSKRVTVMHDVDDDDDDDVDDDTVCDEIKQHAHFMVFATFCCQDNADYLSSKIY